MADFEKAVEKTLNIEKGYSNNPNDYGGETKYGIAKRWHPDVDIKNLTIDRAKEIYKKEYWDELKLGEIRNQLIAEELFDTGVNLSQRKAARFLQMALNLLAEDGPYLIEDGIIGEKTIGAINGYKYPKAILKILNGLQFMHYLKRVEEDETQRGMFRGWLKRT